MKRYPCEESTFELWVGNLQVRLWITNDGGNPDTLAAVASALQGGEDVAVTGRPFESCRQLAERYASMGLPNLAAVQVSIEMKEHGAMGRVGHMIYTVGFE